MSDKNSREYDLVTIPVRVNKKIKEVLELYNRLKVPYKVLMKDYLAVKNKFTQEAFNPWEYHYKGIEKREIECGTSKLESAFNLGAMELKGQNPTDVIRAAFYKRRNDSALECGFLLEDFASELNNESTVIINPSPDMILRCEEQDIVNDYVILDPIISELYKIQFPNIRFFCIDDDPMKSFGRMLIVSRDYPIEKIEMLMKWIRYCQGKVMAVVPNVYLENIKYSALATFHKERFAIEKVLMISPAMTVTSPRKKCLVYLKKTEQEKYWKLSNTVVEKKKFQILEKEVSVEHERFWKDDSTLVKWWNNTALAVDKNVKSKEPNEYIFSKEIHLFYTVYEGRKNRFAGKCWYRALKNVDPFIYGKRVSPIIEKGLRAKTEGEVISNLYQTVLDERVLPYIYTDIVEHFVNCGKSVSLKTLWVLVRHILLSNRNYDENTLQELFELGGEEVGKFDTKEETEEELLRLITEKLKVNNIPTKYLIQLNILFGAAKKEKLITHNPLKELMVSVNKRASERQQEVRDALTKKHFSDMEEKRIFEYLTSSTWDETFKEEIPKCIENSTFLLSLIRLFTGMSLREACALQWRDFVKIDGTEEYQFKISKFIDLKGTVVTHISKEDWLKFRCVPIARPLRILLQLRKDYLLRKGIKNENLEWMPIVMATENISDLKKSMDSGFCKTSKAQEFCRKTLQQAKIEKQQLLLPDAKGELLTDIYKYGGDIFVANIKMRLNHNCGMTLGEINYILGLKANDTFSQHYCDYSNSMVQFAMVEKMNRWTSLYESIICNISEDRFQTGNLAQGKQKILSGPYIKKCASSEIVLKNESDLPCKVELQISTQHEPVVMIRKYGGE